MRGLAIQTPMERRRQTFTFSLSVSCRSSFSTPLRAMPFRRPPHLREMPCRSSNGSELRICRVCGQPLGKSSRHTCVDPRIAPMGPIGSRFFRPMRRAIHALKYSSDRVLASFLVDISYPHFDPPRVDFDRILPVPLGGFGKGNGAIINLCCWPKRFPERRISRLTTKCLIRSRETKSQVGLSHDERRQNVDRAFSAAPVPGREVLMWTTFAQRGLPCRAAPLLSGRAGAQIGRRLDARPGDSSRDWICIPNFRRKE